MGYYSYAIASVLDVPALVGAAAATEGWTVNTTNPNAPIVTHPSLVGAIPFQITASISGTNNQDKVVSWDAVGAGFINSRARISSPKLASASANNPSVPNPSALHVFCSLTPEPYIAAVIEYGYNLYRHLYFGYMEKIGDYDGGECVSGASAGYDAVNYASLETFPYYMSPRHQKLFSAGWTHINSQLTDTDCGGVHVDHASNSSKWRRFRMGTNGVNLLPPTSLPGSTALGGFQDGINNGYLARSRSSYAGATVLVPINLYAVIDPGVNWGLVPLGKPAGVRQIRMDDVLPGNLIEVGNDIWRCFPLYARNSSSNVFGPPGPQWPTSESSGLFGYAYLETEGT